MEHSQHGDRTGSWWRLALVLIPVGLLTWGALSIAFFGPATGCTSEPVCESGTLACGTCAPVRTGIATWTFGQITIVAGLIGLAAAAKTRRSVILATYGATSLILIVAAVFIALTWRDGTAVVPL